MITAKEFLFKIAEMMQDPYRADYVTDYLCDNIHSLSDIPELHNRDQQEWEATSEWLARTNPTPFFKLPKAIQLLVIEKNSK